ncbi:peroxidase P7-like isoform X1 [Zingiber officinale]|uniref:peroxidase P7-like isoform X1 n=1 Tax=Zingiber officinale TaxID=94328 RepID=UPI001C4A88E5|nr:peroxidase P7-like isoform X1 [Zingiber officinale]
MASFTLALLSAALLLCSAAQAQLSSSSFYSRTCPSLPNIVRSTMAQAVNKEPRMAASILRLFFHDCFVNGCDASILLDDTATFTGEKNAFPNINSARGYEVLDAIKSNVEAACPQTVSCADILALAARDGVSLVNSLNIELNPGAKELTWIEMQVGGPNWKVSLGRRDATTASQSDANSNLPGPSSSLSQLVASFAAKGLSAHDMTALSGAHTIGRAQCANFRSHIYDDADIDPSFAAACRRECPSAGGDGNLAPFDLRTPDRFDNSYYQNLVAKRGLLHSDQELFNNGTQDKLVRRYSVNGKAFAKDFAAAMMRMGAISPLTGASGEIRLNCRVVNK